MSLEAKCSLIVWVLVSVACLPVSFLIKEILTSFDVSPFAETHWPHIAIAIPIFNAVVFWLAYRSIMRGK